MTEDYEYYQREAEMEQYREEIIEEALKEISYDGISHYLYYYGDAIETRITGCLDSAKDLHKRHYYGPSIVCSCTSVEVTIRYLILSPLVQGVFLYEEWAELLTKRIFAGTAAKDRELLPGILRFWKIDINKTKLSSGEPVWQVLHDRIWRARNAYAHRGDPVPEELSAQAVEAATLLVKVANDVLVAALGYKKHKHRWGSEEHGKSPFAQE